MKQNVYFSLVIPVYNECHNLQELIRRCLDSCRRIGCPFEIILVDDGSMDSSTTMITLAAQIYGPEVVGVFLNRNYGQHAAVLAGFAQSRGDIVITLDADLQNPPEEIPNLLREVEKGVDVVGTIRAERHDSMFRRLCSHLVNVMVRRATGVMMHDYGCMFRAYRRHIVEAMLHCREHSTFIPVLANSFARTTSEIPVKHEARRLGQSRYSILKLISLQFDLLTSMSTYPLRLLSFLGSAIAVTGILFSAFLLLMRFVMGATWAAQGVFTLFAVLFVFIGAQFIGLGLLGEYIGRIYQDVRARPRYFVQEVIAGTGEELSGQLQLYAEPHISVKNKADMFREKLHENGCPCLS